MSRLRTFYFLVATQTLSIIGSRMTSIAVGIHLFRETGSATPLLLTTFFSELPAMLGNSFAGVLVDRWDRRRVLMLADIGQAVGSVLLMTSFLSGGFELWHLYAVALLQGIFGMFHEPAKDATTALLVPKSGQDRANALQQMSFPFAGVIAPALAAVFYFLVGIGGIIAIDLVTFLVAVIAVYMVHIPSPQQSAEGRSGRGNLYREWLGGLRFLASRPALLNLVIYYGIIAFLVNGPLELAIPYLMTITGSDTLSSIILAVSSLGALVGAVLVTFWSGSRSRVGLMLPALMLTGFMFLIYGTTRSPITLGVSVFLLTIPLPISWALLTSLLIAKTPSDLQGRVLAIALQMAYIGSTLSFLLTGPLVDHLVETQAAVPGDGMGLILVGAGVFILLLTGAFYLLPTVRRMENSIPDYEAMPVTAAGD